MLIFSLGSASSPNFSRRILQSTLRCDTFIELAQFILLQFIHLQFISAHISSSAGNITIFVGLHLTVPLSRIFCGVEYLGATNRKIYVA